MSDEKESLLPSPAPETEQLPKHFLTCLALCFTTALATGVLVVALHDSLPDHISPTLNTYLACILFLQSGSYLRSAFLTQVPQLLDGVINGRGLLDLLHEMPSAVFNVPVIIFTVLVRRMYKEEVAQFMQKHAQVIDRWVFAGYGYLMGFVLAHIPEGKIVSLVLIFVVALSLMTCLVTCVFGVEGVYARVLLWRGEKKEAAAETEELSEIKVQKDA
ncbi:hypothetical protein HDU98_010725 [Podochytrium sp. JEL0797]|nr:hypothetical protein HDU98_010725 [Podochytrium sp. JEL0797]